MRPRPEQVRNIAVAVGIKLIGGAGQDLGKHPGAVSKYRANVPDHLWGAGPRDYALYRSAYEEFTSC